ncbi:MAG: hypothetical protein GF349_00470 [Candidatus Magasanikbacteria bacterium]|nr:hypothetical protein [Candidatus Magasanikbacteria bacterium]
MKKNYEAWNVKVDNFPHDKNLRKQLEFLIKFAVLAPSTHNSQPWLFKIEKNRIEIRKNPSQTLDVADPNDNLMYISIGCALENLLVAANYYGFKYNLEYFFSDFDERVCEVSFRSKNGAKDDREHLIFLIKKRHSNRGKFRQDLPDETILNTIKGFSTEGISVDLVQQKKVKEKVVNIILDAREKAFSDRSFRKELGSYQRNNMTRSFTGMPGFTMGFPTALSFFTPFVLNFVNVVKILRKKDKELLLEYTPAFFVISLDKISSKNCFMAGRIFERIALIAEKNGLATSFQEIPFYLEKMKETINTNNLPKILVRIGYPYQRMAHSPRFGSDKLIY